MVGAASTDDPEFSKVIKLLKTKILNEVLNDWDTWRRKHRKEGDAENTSVSRKERKAEELYNVVAEEYAVPGDDKSAKRIDTWMNELGEDARFNFGSYAECFISENLIRRFIVETKTTLTNKAKDNIAIYQRREKESNREGKYQHRVAKKQYGTELSGHG